MRGGNFLYPSSVQLLQREAWDLPITPIFHDFLLYAIIYRIYDDSRDMWLQFAAIGIRW